MFEMYYGGLGSWTGSPPTGGAPEARAQQTMLEGPAFRKLPTSSEKYFSPSQGNKVKTTANRARERRGVNGRVFANGDRKMAADEISLALFSDRENRKENHREKIFC